MEALQQDWIGKWATYSPDNLAIKNYDTGEAFTYRQLNQRAIQLANRLVHIYDIKPQDRVAVLAENGVEWIVLFAAAQKLNFTIVPLNYRLAASELNYLLENSKPKILITASKFQDLIEGANNYSKIEYTLSLEQLRDLYDPINATQTNKEIILYPAQEDDNIFILYTSGTTGFPKGARYTHNMLFWNSINTALRLIINSESRTINVMPPFHTGGWNVLTTPFLHHGGFVGTLSKFDPETMLSLLDSEKMTLFMAVPTMLKMMADSPNFPEADLALLHYLIVGGEPMPVWLIDRWNAKGIPVRQGYGMTEVGPNLTSLHQRDAIRKKGSIGRPNFYVQHRIVNAEGKDQPKNIPGELLLKGPMVTPGYWQNEEATKKAIQDGWFYTGDMVKEDEEGYLFVVDRIKNMFISGGENVYPAEVERVLLKHPAIAEAAIIGMPDAKWGEVGWAYIVLHDNTQDEISEPELKAYCMEQLAKFKVPKSFNILPELPKNDTGKINRRALKDWKY